MPQALSLESFEEVLSRDDAPSASYNRGYQEGLAAGAATAQSEIAVLDDAFVQALADIEFTYAEARQQILQALRPLFTTLVDQILPQCVQTGFAEQMVAALLEAAAQDTGAPLTLHVHPEAYEAVAAKLADAKITVDLKTDPSLTRHAAWMQHGGAETRLDPDQLLARINAYLAAVTNPEDRIESHG